MRVVINLAPADLSKEGPSFDLPIARALVVPPENAHEASLIKGLAVRTAPNLRALVQHLKGEQPWSGIGCSASA